MKDSRGTNLNVGDIVSNVHGYDLIVKYSEKYGWYGRLVCEKTHPCYRMPYYLGSEEITLKKRYNKKNKQKRNGK